MSRPTSGKVRVRPHSAGKGKTTGTNGDVVSYEDLLVAQYLEELKKSPPYTKQGTRTEPSPYLQKMTSTHIVPTGTPNRSARQRPLSASTTDGGNHRSGKPKVDPRFIADPTMWDPATPREQHTRPRRKRPTSAPVYRRPLSATYGGSRPSSAKSGSSSYMKRGKPLFKRQPYTIVVTAFKNGTRDVFAKVAAPTIKVLLEVCTDKLNLAHAGRRVFLQDGTEVFTPREITRDAEVYISEGEAFKDPYKGAKYQSKMQSSATWTMNGLVFASDMKHSHSKTKLSKRFRNLIEQSRRRVLVFKNGSGTESVEIVADPDRFEDFLVACTAKLDLGSYARVLYDWDGNEVHKLEDAPVLEQCLQAGPTPVLGPLWVSRGTGFSPKGVQVFLTGLINYIRAKLKEAKHYREQLHLAKDESTRDKVDNMNILSMTDAEIENTCDIVGKDIDDFTNALNHLKAQLKKVEEMALEEEAEGYEYTLKHIEKFGMDHKLVGQSGIKLKVYENGTYDEGTVIYFNLTQAYKGIDNDASKVMARLLDQCSGNHTLANPRNNPALKPVAQKLYNQYGREITNVKQLNPDTDDPQEVWLSFGEPFKNPFTYALTAQFDKTQAVDIVGQCRAVIREQLMAEDLHFPNSDKSSTWQTLQGLPEEMEYTEISETTDPMVKEHLTNCLQSGEVDINSPFLRCKKIPSLMLYPELVMDTKKSKGHKDMWPSDAQIWVISKSGYIYSKGMPSLVLGVSGFNISANLGHPTQGKSNTKVEGYAVTLQKKTSGASEQQWRFSEEGVIYAQGMPELFLTYLGSRVGDDESQVQNEAENKAPPGHQFYLAVCEKIDGREARAQRWAIKQERMDNLGQWKHTRAENPEWNKRALSWPVTEKGEINEDFDWPMEGYLIPYAPPLKKADAKNSLVGANPIRLMVLKNGVRDHSQACAVVGPDLTNMRKDLHSGAHRKKCPLSNSYDREFVPEDTITDESDLELLKLEMTLFFERCTSLLNLPFAARRLFDETGKEYFSLQGLQRDQVVYVSCGEAWSNPQLSKAEQQRRYLLSNLASDVAQMKQFVHLRNAEDLVLEVQGSLSAGSRLVVNESAKGQQEAAPDNDEEAVNLAQQQQESDKEQIERMLATESLTPHEIAHLRSEERLQSKKRPWERRNQDVEEVAEANGEAEEFTNKELYYKFRPKRRVDPNLALTLQQFTYEDGFISCQSNPGLVLGVQESEGRAADVLLVKRRVDDIHQRWSIQENGVIQSKHNPQLVLSVSMPSTVSPDNQADVMSYSDCLVTVQPRKTPQFGRANQRWNFDISTGFIHAFATDQMDKEITAANRANVCTFAVMGGNEIDQPGYIAEMQQERGSRARKILVCSSCARAMRGRYKLEKLRDSIDFSCAMGTAKEIGIKQIGSFKCLNGKVDLSTFEAEHTLDEWEAQLQRLRDEMSVRAIAKEISAARVPYTVKVMVYKNGEGRMKAGELIVGSSVLGILEQATYRLGMNTAARRLYTADGSIILDLDDLVEWVRAEFVRQRQQQLREEARAKRKERLEAEQAEKGEQQQKFLSKVDLDEEEEEEQEEEDGDEEDDTEEYMLGYEAVDRQMLDSWSKYMALPNANEAVGLDGYVTQWNFYAKNTGIIILQILRPADEPNTYTIVEQVKIEVTEPGETLIDLTEHPQWHRKGMEVQQGDVLSLYWPGKAVVPFDLDKDVEGSLLYHMPEDEPHKGQQVHMEKWMEHGERKYALNATIVPRLPEDEPQTLDVALQSWNYDDPPAKCKGYIKLNQEICKTFKLIPFNKSLEQGLYIMPVFPWTDTPLQTQVKRFDTQRDKAEAVRLKNYLTELPKGSIALGASAGDIARHLPYVRDVLAEFGVIIGDVSSRLSLAFAGIKGYPGLAKFAIATKGDQGPISLECQVFTGSMGGKKRRNGKKEKKGRKGPVVEPPPTDMILRLPIEVWVSSGEPFVKPERVEQNFARELEQREERAAVAYELDKEKHILRHMQGRRYDKLDPGAYKSTMNPDNPVLIQGNWQEPTPGEEEKFDIVTQLQNHLAEVKNAQRKKLKVCNVATTRRLYTQPAMKRVLIFPNGDSLTKAVYVWGESLAQLLDNATTRLTLRKQGKFLFTIDGQLVKDFDEIARDDILCVALTKAFLKPKDANQVVEIKANWGRARKQYGPKATDIVVATQKNPGVDVDPFGPPQLAASAAQSLPYRPIGSIKS